MGSVLKIALGICLGGLILLFVCCVGCGVLITAGQKEVQRQEQTPEFISLVKFNQLQDGISYKRAVEILGKEGKQVSSSNIAGISTVMYQWENPNSISNMNAMFQNDKLVSKAQFGLR